MTTQLSFDLDSVTPRMLVDFKAKTGANLLTLFDGDGIDLTKAEPEVLAGVIWLALRMSNPAATWEEALDSPFSVLDLDGTEAAPPDPT